VVDPSGFWFVVEPAGPRWPPLAPVGARWPPWVPVGARGCPLAPAGPRWCPLVPVGIATAHGQNWPRIVETRTIATGAIATTPGAQGWCAIAKPPPACMLESRGGWFLS